MVEADDELLIGRTLPEPSLTFTLPSIHDGTTLDCRVYHPFSLSVSPRAPPWQRHAAIVAHPYAPLGGSCDDRIVDVTASTLLRLGYLVCTFNFRGASGSAGRTSWTAKAERADYMSVAGFVAHYAHFLDPFKRAEPADHLPIPQTAQHTPVLLFAGYSYGAMITTQLPSVDTILATFKSPESGTPAAEIRLRAEYMADTENAILASARAAALERQSGSAPMSPRRAMAMRIGGDEQNRKSHDLPRRSFSLDADQKFKDMINKARKGHGKRASSVSVLQRKASGTVSSDHLKDGTGVNIKILGTMTRFQPAYLLISPIQGYVANLATMSISYPFGKKAAKPPKSTKTDQDDTRSPTELNPGHLAWEAEHKLTSNPTLAIYGDRDVFVAAKSLRNWSKRLEAVPASQFRAHEVSTAGHFWTEEGVLFIMRDAVKTFANLLLTSEPAVPELTLEAEK
ncbi:Alpha/Beta hydrolase protein [Coniochaeta sp. 2T2.1]|nr:Alpha/Beta hydrolase protein [Coniochaeta sp. 2T2.1]